VKREEWLPGRMFPPPAACTRIASPGKARENTKKGEKERGKREGGRQPNVSSFSSPRGRGSITFIMLSGLREQRNRWGEKKKKRVKGGRRPVKTS